jgi:hypothetical protein
MRATRNREDETHRQEDIMDPKTFTVQEEIAGFRKRLIEDESFRREFAADPDGTLRRSGISVPAGATIAPIDVAQLDDHVTRLKGALGEDITALYSADEYAQLAKDPQRVQRLQELMSLARTPELAASELAAVAGGKVNTEQVAYTISAFSTLDW